MGCVYGIAEEAEKFLEILTERQDIIMDYRRFGNAVVIRIDRYEEVM